MLTSETGKNINKGPVMNHSKEFGRIEKSGPIVEPIKK